MKDLLRAYSKKSEIQPSEMNLGGTQWRWQSILIANGAVAEPRPLAVRVASFMLQIEKTSARPRDLTEWTDILYLCMLLFYSQESENIVLLSYLVRN